MKSDKNMADNVLMRLADIKQQKKQQKKMVVKTFSVAFAFIFVFMVGVTLFNYGADINVTESGTHIEATTEKEVNKAFSIVVASAAENTETLTINKELGVSIPFGGLLYVKDTRNISDKSYVAYEVECKLNEIFGENDKWSVTGIEGDTCVYFGTVDYLSLDVADADEIEEIILTCGASGKLITYDKSLLGDIKAFHKTIKGGKEIVVTGEEYKNFYAGSEGMVFKWQPSEELHEYFSKNPSAALSGVSDSIDGLIRYIDGTEESFTITLSFDDNGILDATYSYNK